MARLLPKALVEQLRRFHFLIGIGVEAAADILLQLLPNNIALGMPEHAALRFLLEMEQVHLAADFAVVALFGFLNHMQIGFEVFFIAPACAVNALQHFIIAVAAPISTGQLGQLKRLAQLAGGRQMRATAQIFPRALTIDRHFLVDRNSGDDFRFIVFADLFEMRHRFVAVPHFAYNLLIAVDNFFHAFFNRFQIVKTERHLAREIVIKAVFDNRPNGHLRTRKKLLHRLGQHVCAIMAHQLHAILIGSGNNGHIGISVDAPRQINHLAIDLPSERFFGQRFGNRIGKSQPVNRGVKFAGRPVG